MKRLFTVWMASLTANPLSSCRWLVVFTLDSLSNEAPISFVIL